MRPNYRFSSSAPSLQPSLGVQGMSAGRAASRASASTRRTQNRRRRSMDFVINVQESLQDEKLSQKEDVDPDDFLQDGSKRWQPGDPHHFTVPRNGDPWEGCFKQVQKFDEEMCRAWREEIDTLLVFAGLFSAAVTAFTVESYRWLRAEPEQVVNVQLLALIATQLNATGIPPLTESFSPDASEVRVNIFWFTSLTLSLTAVLFGILCKQWLREYQRYEGLSPKEAFPVREMRYEGLLNWHVPKILSFLPLLLQSALLIFFAGLLDLLWSLHPLLASIISSLVGIVMILLASTTVLPFAQYLFHFARLSPTAEPSSQCAFKSPQSRAFHLLGTSLLSFYTQLQLSTFGTTAEDYLRSVPSWDSDANWVNYDLEWQNRGKYMQRGISWFEKTYGRNVESAYHIFHCLESLNEDVAAGCVSQIIYDTWDFFMPLTDLFLACLEAVEIIPQTEGREQRLGRDMVGMCYSFMHWKADMCFGERCMELCTRIANYDQGSYTEVEERGYASLVLEVLKIVVPAKGTATALPNALHLQVVAILKSIFREDRVDIDASDIPSFWVIFDRLRQHQYHGFDLSGRNSQWLAYDLLQEAELWLSRLMDSTAVPVHDKERIVKDFSNGLVGVYRTARGNLEVDALKSSTFFGTFCGFVQFIDGLLQNLMGTSLILYPWDLDDWEVVKLEFGPLSPAVDPEAAAKGTETPS